MQYILAHDLGTTGNKATLYNQKGELEASAFAGYETYYPKANWVEQAPDDWWEAVCQSTKKLIKETGIEKNMISVISFSGQMMGCLPLNQAGKPLYRSIIWADQRSTKQAEKLRDEVGAGRIYEITGHRLSPSYSAEKIMWIMDNKPSVYEDTHKFVHAKDFIVQKLTGNFLTDYSDASGMNLYDIKNKEWSNEIIEAMNLDRNKLPEVHSSFEVVGEVKSSIEKKLGVSAGTPVVLGSGDGPAASVGAAVVEKGKAYNYLGSSSWIALATDNPIMDPERKTFNWIHMDPDKYMPCGTMQAAGASYRWLKENLCQPEQQAADNIDADVYELMNLSVEDSDPGANKLIYLPYLLGERSPHWDPEAQGAFIGLTAKHDRKDMIRSVMEGVTFNLKIISEAFENEVEFSKIRVIGGGAKGEIWRKIMADIYQKDVLLPETLEQATSLGAAIAGGVGVGIFDNIEVVEQLNPVVDKQTPRLENTQHYQQLYSIFKESYHALKEVYHKLSGV